MYIIIIGVGMWGQWCTDYSLKLTPAKGNSLSYQELEFWYTIRFVPEQLWFTSNEGLTLSDT